ncbi:hypothetical protein KKH24_01200 [Patescibacteria group bacterium]|nr:hypothetical protein [Patescibacteria group bacterium]
MFIKLLRLLRKTETLDILCLALRNEINNQATRVKILDRVSKIEDIILAQEELKKAQELFLALLKYASREFRYSLTVEDFMLMNLAIPDWLPHLQILERQKEADAGDFETPCRVIEVDFSAKRRE